MFPKSIVLFCFVIFGITNALEKNVDYGDPQMENMLNYCIDSKNHKERPGPEDSLHLQCSPWKNRSCCTDGTSLDLHYTKMYSFDWNHCSIKKNLSEKCRKHFVQDLCFYECSPNVGPWVVGVNNTFRKERFFKVPLCKSECTAWFEDCKDDYTCTDNWPRNMEFIKGLGNKCPNGSSCQTFQKIYGSASNFCETVWDHSWEVVDDSEPCMKIWFDGKNPNDKVAEWKAAQLLKIKKTSSSSSGFQQPSFLLVLVGLMRFYVMANL